MSSLRPKSMLTKHFKAQGSVVTSNSDMCQTFILVFYLFVQGVLDPCIRSRICSSIANNDIAAASQLLLDLKIPHWAVAKAATIKDCES